MKYTSLSSPAVSQALLAGAVAVIPTDTVYGLVACATNETAVKRMYSLKKRERQPGTIIAASTKQLEDLGFSRENLLVGNQYWPNAVSIVLDAKNVPEYLKCNLPDLPVRVPKHAALQQLLAVTGPLMTTSANAPKEPTSTSVDMAMDYFGDSVDFYVDGGDLSHHAASTIIGLKPNGELIIYRHGAVSIEPRA